MKKKILIAFLALLLVIQFIRPSRNVSAKTSPDDIAAHYAVPAHVQQLLDHACNDCHSDNTRYPWYVNIQPVGWWMQHHVNDGKEELNFSEFASYTAKKQNHKLRSVIEQIKKGDMPLDSYLWIHKDAVLSDVDKQALITWADSLKKQIAVANNLPDEPVRPESKR